MKKKLFAMAMLFVAMTSFLFTGCQPEDDPNLEPTPGGNTTASAIIGSWKMNTATMFTEQGPMDYTSFYGTLILEFNTDGTVDMTDNFTVTTWNWRIDENNNLVFFHPDDSHEINWLVQTITDNYLKLYYDNNGTEMEMEFDRVD